MLAAEAQWHEARAAAAAAAQALRLYGLDEGAVRRVGDGTGAALLSIRAPVAGRIVEHHAALGELVTPEARLMTVADLSRVWVWIDVPERDVAAVHVEDQVEVRSDAWRDEAFHGEVSYLTPEVDAGTRTVRARIEADNPGRKLLPGMFVTVRIVDPHVEGGSESVVVPAAAVQRQGSTSIVFVGLGDRRFERREVRLGSSTSSWIEILEGLREGEPVVVEGAFILKTEASRDRLGGGHSH
jgi:RND family efflux transporter MFP subunit